MKIGLSSYSISRAIWAGEMNILDAIRWIAEKGGEHMEVVPGAFQIKDAGDPIIQQIRDTAKECGIALSNYAVSGNFAVGGPEERKKEVERLKGQVDIAAALGVSLMRHDAAHFGGDAKQNSIEAFDRLLPQMAEGCAAVSEYAAQYGITTSIENHGWFNNGAERVIRLVKAVGRDNFGLTLDVGNFVCVDECPNIAVEKCLPYATMVHFKDFYLRHNSLESLNAGGGCWFPSQFGTAICGSIVGWGDLDIPGIVAAIAKSGYDGFVSIEFEGAEECRYASQCGLGVLKGLFAAHQA